MRRALAVAVLIGALGLGTVPASAHGTCTLTAWKPFVVSGVGIEFGATIDCNGQRHNFLDVNACVQRRLPGGSWAYPPSGTYCALGGSANVSKDSVGAAAAYDCRYDYRSKADGQPSGHAQMFDNSAPYPAQC